MAQKKQKAWNDQKEREMKLTPEDKVMVLLPTWNEKLLAKWKGQYKILHQVRKENYKLEIEGREGEKLFHNMLKRWNKPTRIC